MEYPLSINWIVGSDSKNRHVMSQVLSVKIDAELGELAEFGYPDSFSGRLSGLSLREILHLASADGVEVGFRGGRYKMERLEIDGSCQICYFPALRRSVNVARPLE